MIRLLRPCDIQFMVAGRSLLWQVFVLGMIHARLQANLLASQLSQESQVSSEGSRNIPQDPSTRLRDDQW
jgi:hypothetical protein